MVATTVLALLLLISGFSLPTLAAEATDDGSLSAEEIVSRAIALSQAQYENLDYARFESRQTSKQESLAANGGVTNSETLIYRQYPLEGVLYDELVQKDGRPLNAKENREEQKRRSKFVKKVRKRRARGIHPQPEEGPGIRFDHELMDRYRVEVTGAEKVRGYDCWLISFEPLKGKLPNRNRMDPALNNSTGNLWISKQDYGLVRFEFVMREPFRYWGGLLATIKQAEGRLEFERVAPETWLQLNFDFRLDVEVLMVKNIRRHITSTWTDYQLAEVTRLERAR